MTTWTIAKFELPLCLSLQSKPQLINIVDAVEFDLDKAMSMPYDASDRFWFGAEYNQWDDGAAFKNMKELLKEVAIKGGFTATVGRASKRRLVIECKMKAMEKCKFRLSINFCPENKRWFIKKVSGGCLNHVCNQQQVQLRRKNLDVEAKKELELLFYSSQRKCSLLLPRAQKKSSIINGEVVAGKDKHADESSVEAGEEKKIEDSNGDSKGRLEEKAVYFSSMSGFGLWTQLLRNLGREEDQKFLDEAEMLDDYYHTYSPLDEAKKSLLKYSPSIGYNQVSSHIQSLRAKSATSLIYYCKYDNELMDIKMQLKPILDKLKRPGRQTKNSRGTHYGGAGDEKWPIRDHEHYNNQIYSGNKFDTYFKEIGKGKRKQIIFMKEKDQLTTLVNADPGREVKMCNNIDIERRQPNNNTGDGSRWEVHPIWKYFQDRGFDVGVGSYHWAATDDDDEWKQDEDGLRRLDHLTIYKGHCDTRYFNFVIFMVVQCWTWVLIAVPRGSTVADNSNDEFEIWRGKQPAKDQQEIKEYLEMFKRKAPGAMQTKFKENLTDNIDIHIYRLDPGGFLTFNANNLYHSTLTPHQTSKCFRQFLALHNYQWFRPVTGE